jgi:beta-xylosidase
MDLSPKDSSEGTNLTLADIPIRDPNILYSNGLYYMTGTTAWDGFLGFSSPDLITWTAHGHIYQKNESNYWAQYNFWAPEMVELNGKFYLFFTGISDSSKRRTGVAVADHPLGPYVDLMAEPLTPPEYHCLDGHFAIDTDGKYYLFYVYEWINDGTGEMWVQELSTDLMQLIGEPKVLFQGPDARWGNGVVDGPSLLIDQGKYFLFWSSFNQKNYGKYGVGYATADSIMGSYTQSAEPIITQDGGHTTWFYEKSTGKRLITYHQPNSQTERAQIRELIWDEERKKWAISPGEDLGLFGPYPLFWIRILEYFGIGVGAVILLMIIRFSVKKKKNKQLNLQGELKS